MKRWWWAVGALVALVLVLVVVDRVTVRVAESTAVRSMEQGDVELTDANLDIQGFPFLTQVAAGELGHVTGTATAATFGGYTVTDVRIDARDVSTTDPYVVKSGSSSRTWRSWGCRSRRACRPGSTAPRSPSTSPS
jgi:hypothetical protein